MNITINIDALAITIGGQTVTGSASVVVPVTSDQLIVLLQSGSQAAAAPILAVQQPTIAAPAPIAPVEVLVAVPEQPVVDPVPVAIEPEPETEAEPVEPEPVQGRVSILKERGPGVVSLPA